jgi:multisite-specific tRNA:(cytosine-C5)-methyltransferase
MGHGIHTLQLEILERGFKLLKKGGRLVYSTCSFNPLENEAVIAAALARHRKQMKILDVSKEVSPDLKYRPGLTSWKVYHRGKGKNHPPMFFKTFDEVPEFKRRVIKETMFTDPYTEMNNDPMMVKNP